MTKTSTFVHLAIATLTFPVLTTADEDGGGYLNTPRFSWGTMHIFTAYVATISICVGEYRKAVEDTPAWNSSEEMLAQAKSAIWSAAMEAMGIFLLLIVLAAIAIPLLTIPLDKRMEHIIEGISRLISAVIQAMLSLRVAIWVDLYQQPFVSQAIQIKRIGTTTIELKHRVRWSVSKRILRSFFYLLILFQGATGITIPGSILAGLAFGLFIDWGVYKARRFQSASARKCFSVCFVLFMAAASILQCATGALYIANVWQDEGANLGWEAYVFLAGCGILPLAHLLVWCMGRKRASIVEHDDQADNGSAANKSSSPKTRMATSMLVIDWKGTAGMEEEQHVDEADGIKSEMAREGTSAALDETEKMAAAGEGYEARDDTSTEKVPSPTLWALMMDWQWCGCARGEEKTCTEKTYNVVIWILYLVLCALSLLSLVCNIGATQQQEHARSKLPYVHRAIYETMDEGPVCAFDNRGADSNITTFPDKDAAHDAGFLVLHCGACGACSDWHNLRLEYTTRNFLATESQKCAMGSLFGGGYDALVECLEADAIGFQGQCAICWADDILCTKDFCWAIGFQSFFINTLGNFEVGSDTVTAAACEEAHCEANNPGGFVDCSGATRRRMNITSSIARPGAQRCGIVDVDWAELFPEDEEQ